MRRIPVLCRCGNAILNARTPNIPAAAVWISCSPCDICDDGDFGDELYIAADGTSIDPEAEDAP